MLWPLLHLISIYLSLHLIIPSLKGWFLSTRWFWNSKSERLDHIQDTQYKFIFWIDGRKMTSVRQSTFYLKSKYTMDSSKNIDISLRSLLWTPIFFARQWQLFGSLQKMDSFLVFILNLLTPVLIFKCNIWNNLTCFKTHEVKQLTLHYNTKEAMPVWWK